MDVAIVGAAGACGRQLAGQLLQRHTILPSDRLQLVGHAGGASEHELWGLRSDLEDAFADRAPVVELAFDPDGVDADLVVMLAGRTVSLDPGAPVDRAGLAAHNAALFRDYAVALARRADPPIVVVQSNPVELGVRILAEHLPPERVLGAAAWSDTLRLRRELATDLGISRRDVAVFVLGEHGDHMVPVWSSVDVRGRGPSAAGDLVRSVRGDRRLADLPEQIVAARTELLDLVRAERVAEAWTFVQSLPADLRAAVKPYFTNFTSGRTTEVATAHAVADLVDAFVAGVRWAVPAQVWVRGLWQDLTSAIAVPVVVAQNGWVPALDVRVAADELDALRVADRALGEVQTAALTNLQ